MKTNEQLSDFLNSEGLTKDSILFRYTLPDYLRKTIEGTCFISANSEATEMIRDIYGSGHSIMAKFVAKGLAFTTSIEKDFRTDEHKLVSVKLGDVLEQGGLIYPDISSYAPNSQAYFITLPNGEIIVGELE